MDKNIEIVSSLIATIEQSDEWFRICREDPRIQEANQCLRSVMERVGAKIPDELLDELWNAISNIEEANETAAMLYGIRVDNAVRDVAARPSELSQHILARMRASA